MVSTKIKVKRTDLIKKVEQAKAKAVKVHEKAVADYEKAVETFTVAKSKALTAARQTPVDKLKVKSEYWSGNSYGSCIIIPIGKNHPPKPGALDTSHYDRDLAVLEIAQDDLLSVSTGDRFGRYL